MKKLEFLITVPDKYTKETYEAGKVYEFEDKRADEILSARTPVTKEPYAKEFVDNVDIVVDTVTLEELKVAELKQLASNIGIKGYDKMKKAELIEAIKNND